MGRAFGGDANAPPVRRGVRGGDAGFGLGRYGVTLLDVRAFVRADPLLSCAVRRR